MAKFSDTRVDAERRGRLEGGDDQQLVHAGVGGAVAAHQVQRHAVRAPGHEVQDRLQVAVRAGGAVLAPCGRWRRRSRRRAGSPKRPSAMEKPRSVSVPRQPSAARRICSSSLLAEVADAPHPGLVAGPLDAVDHLAHVAHGPAVEGEVGDVHDRLVAELQRVQAGLAGPHLAAGLAAPHDGGHPGVRPGLLHEALDRARPGLDVADRVAAGQHHAGDDAVGDRGLAAGGEDHGLVAAQREVAQRVAAAVLASRARSRSSSSSVSRAAGCSGRKAR